MAFIEGEKAAPVKSFKRQTKKCGDFWQANKQKKWGLETSFTISENPVVLIEFV